MNLGNGMQQDWCAERDQVAPDHGIAAFGCIAGNVHRLVEGSAGRAQAVLVFVDAAGRGPVVFLRIVRFAGEQAVLQGLERLTGQDNGFPRLVVAAGRRHAGLFEYAANGFERNWAIEKGAHGTARCDGFDNIHEFSGAPMVSRLRADAVRGARDMIAYRFCNFSLGARATE
jgi:hypothetical protein